MSALNQLLAISDVLPGNVLGFLSVKERANFSAVARGYRTAVTETSFYDQCEAEKISGIFKKVSENSKLLEGDHKRRWVAEKVDSLLAQGKALLTPKEWAEANFDPNLPTLTAFEKVKMGELIADKRARILINFFKLLGNNLPEAAEFFAQILPALPSREIAKQIRQWMHENPTLLAREGLIDRSFFNSEDMSFPKESILVSSMDDHFFQEIFRIGAKQGHIEVVKECLRSNIRELSTECIVDVLYIAAEHGRLEVVKFLMSFGRELSSEAIRQALWKASGFGHLEVVKFLMTSNEEILSVNFGEYFVIAATYGHLEVMKFFMASGRQISSEYFGLGFSRAATENQLEAMKLMMASGREISKGGLSGAWIWAFVSRNLEMMGFLMASGREISAEDFGKAFRTAVEKGHLEVLKFLMDSGREISVKDFGRVFRLAAEKGHLEVVKLLVDSGRKIYAKHFGWAFSEAAEKGHLGIVKLLIASSREIPLEILLLDGCAVAAYNGHWEVAKFVLSYLVARELEFRGG